MKTIIEPKPGVNAALELERQAEPILRRLADRQSFLAPFAREEEKQAVFGLFSPKNHFARPVLTVAGAILRGLHARDWLEQAGEEFRISAPGLAWLKRRLSGADRFQEQHGPRSMRHIGDGDAKRPVTVNNGESPLSWLRSRKDRNGAPLITAYQHEAGERLRADFWRAQMTPKVTASWDGVAGSKRARRGAPGNAAALREHVIAARQRVERALAAAGPELAGVLLDVCCFLKGLEEAEKSEGWPQRAGKVVLQIALTRLARHYGLINDADLSAPVRRRLQHWGAEDYRPSIGA